MNPVERCSLMLCLGERGPHASTFMTLRLSSHRALSLTSYKLQAAIGASGMGTPISLHRQSSPAAPNNFLVQSFQLMDLEGSRPQPQ